MTVTIQVQKDLRNYTFVDFVEMKGTTVLIHYDNGKIKKVPYRATIERLIKVVDEIKKEVGFDETKRLRDEKVKKEIKKPMMFVNV